MRAINRRTALAITAAAAAAAAGVGAGAMTGTGMSAAGREAELAPAAWADFAARFVAADGRVVDTGNAGISHSEGQGYGMLLAAAARDRAAFRRLWDWTRSQLMVRPDGLVAWKWEPGKGVTDPNNATDGDVLIAWALLRAGELWPDSGLREPGVTLTRAVARHLVVRHAGLTLPLPGMEGFRKGTAVVVNPSYLVFPAFRAMAAADPDGPWQELVTSGLVLLAKARFSQWQLPPDWAQVEADGTVTLPDGFRKQFGYDAIRVPLYLAWGGLRDPYYFRPYGALTARFAGGPVPATVSLPGGTTAQVAASSGMLAVHRLAARLASTGANVTVPPGATGEDYYSTVLLLLTRLAERSLGFAP
ncbi:glycosyl hydrolase family 8 [Azospirillum halopraeferens]|uniref:glycosyl hydrolase family 8 n=1 Tax=Azospirillum halopraeferens TaxID=34010 RepID=UPI00040592F2|nr:glycosyl hydrolase family 8 [Azospirillum halopraeferens]